MTASVPHFSVSLLTLSFSTWTAPVYFTSASIVPPPCAASRGMPKNAPDQTALTRAVSAASSFRIAVRPPDSALRRRPPIRNSHYEHHRRKSEESHHGRYDETALGLRLLQPQIVPRRQRHL